MELICKLHGFPKSIVSDRDPIFVSNFWRELFRLSGTHLRLSTAYHPQSDGQTEVINRVLEQYLRCFVHDHPSSWFPYLALAEWCYNTSRHSGSGLTPFEITYGKPPPTIMDYIHGATKNEAVHTVLVERQALHSKLQQRLRKAQELMKKYADAKREDITFEVGQWVYVKLKPGRQTSITAQRHPKLSKRFFGPFQILERIGSVAYRLQLPPESRIHPVFHSSLLRPHYDALPATDKDWPLQTQDQQPLRKPLCFLDSHFDSTTTPPTRWVLTQWVGEPPEDTTWESWPELREAYHFEDKVDLWEGGNVSNTSQTQSSPTIPSPVTATARPARLRIPLHTYVTMIRTHEGNECRNLNVIIIIKDSCMFRIKHVLK